MRVAKNEGDKIMNWQSRLEKTAIALNLLGLAFGFCILGVLVLAKGKGAGGTWVSGSLGIAVGALFLLFAIYFCKHSRGASRDTRTALKADLKKGELSSLKKIII
jgi:hypothetical protein